MVVGTHQSLQFFRENTQFLENNRALFNFLYGFLHYLISITKYKKTVHKTQFYINHASHLKEIVKWFYKLRLYKGPVKFQFFT